MPACSTKEVVENMLCDMREALGQDNFHFVNRRKNLNSLMSLGLKLIDVKEALNELTYTDYIRGPEIDRDFPSTDKLWIFKKRIINEIFYIKLKVEYQANGQVKVVSFHIDE